MNSESSGFLSRWIRFFLERKLVTLLLLIALILGGLAVAPFDRDFGGLPRRPIPVDAIPNLGENQQVVFTEWPGRSPQDVENQVTYPLSAALTGIPGVREIRSSSMFGASMIFLIFDDSVEFYWSRARIVEKLNSLPAGLLPMDAEPALGPDATALGQIFWYTLEGRDPDGRPVGGWDLHEVRSVQDWTVRYALQAAEGVSEVASIGGYVREYQVDVNPDALRAHGVTLDQVVEAVRGSNLDMGAGVTEINRVEYSLRGLGLLRGLPDLEQTVIRVGADRQPIRIRDVAVVTLGPAPRRGALTQQGAETAGGVVVVREGYNPLRAIQNVKAKIAEISSGLPSRAVPDWRRTDPRRLEAFALAQGFVAFDGADLNQEAWLGWLRTHPREQWPDGVTISRLEIVSFYDRSGLIRETLTTLDSALVQQTVITILVILLLLLHLRPALLISAMLPLAVLVCFLLMKAAGVDSHLVSLGGIAIAIGAIVDMGIILTENVLLHLREAPPEKPRIEVVFRAAREVGSAMITAISTTVVGFLPVFAMTGPEGKLFTPLAYTWTFVLFSSIFIALTLLPAGIHLLLAGRDSPSAGRRSFRFGWGVAAAATAGYAVWRGWTAVWILALILLASLWLRGPLRRLGQKGQARFGISGAVLARWRRRRMWISNITAILAVVWILARLWEPLGPERGDLRNLIFVGLLVGILMGALFLILWGYRRMLGWALRHKAAYLSIPALLLMTGLSVWMGFDRVFGFIPAAIGRVGFDARALRSSKPWTWAAHEFPGLGRQFMPPLDEGSFLWMPTTMPHASIGEVLAVLQHQDRAISGIPEVDSV
ncbi:MAG: efflux RND transporter permease subunit, partial [Kiritimatiellia bacterium]|nr:efflux RND transporter permease subunit [Kiritimatiellia bacterium]